MTKVTFAAVVQSTLESVDEKDLNSLKRQLALLQLKDSPALKFYNALAAQISEKVLAIAEKKADIVIRDFNQILVGSTEGNADEARKFILKPDPKNGSDLFESLREEVAKCHFTPLKLLMQEHGIKKFLVFRQYDDDKEWLVIYACI